MQPTPSKLSKQPSNLKQKQKVLVSFQTINLPKSLHSQTTRQQRKQVFNIIYQLKIKQHLQLKQKLLQVLTSQDSSLETLFIEFKTLMEYFKEHQTMTPIIDIYYSVYRDRMLVKRQNDDKDIDVFWNNWKSVPMTHLESYFKTFNLEKIVNQTNPSEQLYEQYRFYNIMRDLLLRGKNKEAALYYRLFNLNDTQFLIKEMLPRLLQGQDLYSNYVMNLFKQNITLLNAIVQQIDPVAGIRIVQSINGDVSQYPKLIQHMQYSSFKHHANEFKDWFKCEEIFSFCPLFLKWYAEEYLEEPIKSSVLIRNKLKEAKEGQEIVKNPLIDGDQFTYSEEIIGKHQDKKYWKLQDLGIQQQDVIFVDEDSSEGYKLMEKTLLGARVIGFDSEFRAASHKYEQSGVSIIQLSADKKIFIIDFIKLSASEKVISFLRKVFLSEEILKVGHSLKCDFLYLNKTMNLQSNDLNSFIDIADLFKIKYPAENQSSLSHIVLAMTGVLLSKYQQRSNWNKRPLRKSQLHYAAFDAYICQIIYDKLNQDIQLKSQKLEKKEKIITLIVQDGWLSYGNQYAHCIDKPKFLVDNMLKRLSTYLRNLGLDAQYLTVRDFNLAISIASNQNRIIITKDKHLKFKKNIRVPIYLVQSQQSQTMTKQVVAAFKINLQDYELLSRCVKCNNSELILVDRETALAKLNFKHKDSAITEFWSCSKCQQFYWEGHSYNNSRKRFASFI